MALVNVCVSLWDLNDDDTQNSFILIPLIPSVLAPDGMFSLPP